MPGRLTQALPQRLERSPHFLYRLFLLSFLGAALFAFAHVVEDYLTGDPIVRWDVRLAVWLHGHTSELLLSGFKVLTFAGNAAVLALLTCAGLALLWRRGARTDAYLLAGVALGVEVLNAGLKLAFHRPRPELAYVHLDTYSFPSGHAAGAAAVYGVLVFLLARGASRRRRVALGVGVVALLALVDFSRLYLGAHYLSDVLAGSALGASWLAACLLVHELRRSS
jgi:membrane-associated phospholipid phosphatase